MRQLRRVALSVALIAAVGCKTTADDAQSKLDSGGGDPAGLNCEALRQDFLKQKVTFLEYQAGFAAAYTAANPTGLNLAGDPPPGDAPIRKLGDDEEVPAELSLGGGTVKKLEDCFALSSAGELQQKCRDTFTKHATLRKIAEAHDNPARPDNCITGGGMRNITLVTFGYCDVPCALGNPTCALCPFEYKFLGAQRRDDVLCSSKAGAADAIAGFCSSPINTGITDCRAAGECEVKKGSEFITSQAGVSTTQGGEETAISVTLAAYLGATASVEITAGVELKASAQARGTLEGTISIVGTNPSEPVMRAGRGNSATEARCTVTINRIAALSFDGSAGAGFEFNIGVAKAGASATIDAGGSFTLTNAFTKSSPAFSVAGFKRLDIVAQCYKYMVTWIDEFIKTALPAEKLFLQRVKSRAQVAQEEAEERSATDAGHSAASNVYSELAPYIGYTNACYCHNWHCRGNRDISAEGAASCREKSNAYGANAWRFNNACYDELNRKCQR